MSLIGHHRQFNQLFNFVNYVDQIELDPWQSQKIIIAFLPENKVPDREIGSASLEEPVYHQDARAESSFDYFEVNGLLFFLCFKDLPKMGIYAKEVVKC